MADDLRNTGFGAFDSHRDKNGEKDSGFLSAFMSVISNRYFDLALIFVSFGVIIFFMTAGLQFSDYQKTISVVTKGVARQMTVVASLTQPRIAS